MSPLTVVRLGLPLAMVLLGVGLIVWGGEQADAAGVTIIGSAALVSLANALVRYSMHESGDRDREQDARDYYREHGRWPGED